jgi:hypothetical protein
LPHARTTVARPGAPNGAKGMTLPLGKFHAVVFVDLFFRVPLNSPITFEDGLYACIDGVPVSCDQIGTYRLPWLGFQRLVKHKVYGDVPLQAAWDVLEVFRAARADIPLFLLPQPVEPAANRGDLLDKRQTRHFVAGLDAYYQHALARIGVRYVSQPSASREPESGLTLSSLSRGSLASDPAKLDPHLNVEYGMMAVRELLREIAEHAGERLESA